jgi:hypothetical protein
MLDERDHKGQAEVGQAQMFRGKFHHISLFWEDLLIGIDVVIFKKRNKISGNKFYSSKLKKFQNFKEIAYLFHKCKKGGCKLILFVFFELKFVFEDFDIHGGFLVKDKAFLIIYHAVFQKFIVLLVFVPIVFSNDRSQYFIKFKRNIANNPGFLVHLSFYCIIFSFIVTRKEFVFQICSDCI